MAVVHAARTVPIAAAGSAYAALQWLGRTYGATPDERHCTLPGDFVVDAPQVVVTHATTIDAPPAQVWPWLLQMGWHRGGWYTARWVDRLLFPANAPSAAELVQSLQHLQVGDFIPDGPPETECGFTVRSIEEPHFLVLYSTTHLPLSWRRRGWAAVAWTWSFVLLPLDGGSSTRFLFRWRAQAAPWWLVLGCQTLVVPADFVMSRDMLRGIRSRAEQNPCSTSAVLTPG